MNEKIFDGYVKTIQTDDGRYYHENDLKKIIKAIEIEVRREFIESIKNASNN